MQNHPTLYGHRRGSMASQVVKLQGTVAISGTPGSASLQTNEADKCTLDAVSQRIRAFCSEVCRLIFLTCRRMCQLPASETTALQKKTPVDLANSRQKQPWKPVLSTSDSSCCKAQSLSQKVWWPAWGTGTLGRQVSLRRMAHGPQSPFSATLLRQLVVLHSQAQKEQLQ